MQVYITIGGDPEFEIFSRDTGELIPASEFGWISLRSQIGCDGHPATGELRPTAGRPIERGWRDTFSSFAGLLSDIGQTLRTARYNAQISMVGNTKALGGHVHFGMQEHPDFVRVLDWLSARVVFRESGMARGEYLLLGATRPQPHGFEYRSLPASIWGHPVRLQAWLEVLHVLGSRFIAGELEIPAEMRQPYTHDVTEFELRAALNRHSDCENREEKERILTLVQKKQEVVWEFLTDQGFDEEHMRGLVIWRDAQDVLKNWDLSCSDEDWLREVVIHHGNNCTWWWGQMCDDLRGIVHSTGGLHERRGQYVFAYTNGNDRNSRVEHERFYLLRPEGLVQVSNPLAHEEVVVKRLPSVGRFARSHILWASKPIRFCATPFERDVAYGVINTVRKEGRSI